MKTAKKCTTKEPEIESMAKHCSLYAIKKSTTAYRGTLNKKGGEKKEPREPHVKSDHNPPS